MIEKKKIEEDSKSFKSLSRIAKFKLKSYEELHRVEMKKQDPDIRITNFE